MEEKLDVLDYVLREVMAAHPSFTEEQARALLPKLHAQLGGDKYYIPKVSPTQADERRRAIHRDALTTSLSTNDLQRRHGVSRRTIYRLVKRAPSS